jgi:hypothetical protein
MVKRTRCYGCNMLGYYRGAERTSALDTRPTYCGHSLPCPVHAPQSTCYAGKGSALYCALPSGHSGECADTKGGR